MVQKQYFNICQYFFTVHFLLCIFSIRIKFYMCGTSLFLFPWEMKEWPGFSWGDALNRLEIDLESGLGGATAKLTKQQSCISGILSELDKSKRITISIIR